MRILTWNINSVRLRLPLLLDLLRLTNADIACLQETKTPDEFFPREALVDAGYKHIHINGMKGYNGVAILSRLPFKDPRIHSRCGKDDSRHISAQFDGFELHNLYIPAGGDIPDPDVNDKFRHKLDFIEDVTNFFAKNYRSKDPLVALGDFNIAPQEHDVWSHKQLLNVVSHTPPETDRLAGMLESLNWTDATRHFIPADQKAYTWWSYRNQDWKKSNRGRRLDHIWLTKPVAKTLTGHMILPETRDWTQTSDHVPVVIDIA